MPTDIPSQSRRANMFIAVLLIAALAGAQELTPQKLFEAGKYQEAIDKVKARDDAPRDQIYLPFAKTVRLPPDSAPS